MAEKNVCGDGNIEGIIELVTDDELRKTSEQVQHMLHEAQPDNVRMNMIAFD